jgi:hypothetical protein
MHGLNLLCMSALQLRITSADLSGLPLIFSVPFPVGLLHA